MRHKLLALWFGTVLVSPFPAVFAAGTGDRAGSVLSEAGAGFEASTPSRNTADAGSPIDWLHIPPSRYATALNGYRSSVAAGNPTSLGSSSVQMLWAQYMNAMHNRLHPLFSEQFLGRLDQLDATDALNEKALMVRLEIALDARGRIARLGVVHSSGLASFDLAALEAFSRAAPFAASPSDLWSDDGMTYLHWELHRDGVYACSTMNARPFRLAGVAGDGGARAAACRPVFRYVISDAGRESWEKVDCSAQQGDAGRQQELP
jgi:TonB family protein